MHTLLLERSDKEQVQVRAQTKNIGYGGKHCWGILYLPKCDVGVMCRIRHVQFSMVLEAHGKEQEGVEHRAEGLEICVQNTLHVLKLIKDSHNTKDP